MQQAFMVLESINYSWQTTGNWKESNTVEQKQSERLYKEIDVSVHYWMHWDIHLFVKQLEYIIVFS